MHLITKALTFEPPSSRSLRAKPRAFTSETHRLKESLSDSLAWAQDTLAVPVFFFCANTAVDAATLTASAAAAVANMSRIAFLPDATTRCNDFSVGNGLNACPPSKRKPHISKCASKIYFGLVVRMALESCR